MDAPEEQTGQTEEPLGRAGKNRNSGHPTFRVVDKRKFVDLDAIPKEGPVEEKPRYPSFVEELLGRVAEVEKRFEERKKQIDAEIRRSRERLEADFQRNLEIEKQKIVTPFLDIMDNLQRALAAARAADNPASLIAGLEMIATQLEASLRTQGVEALTLVNQPYDPKVGHAVGVIPTTDATMDGVVVEEVLRGYRMGDQLLRPAQVRVAQLTHDSNP